MSELSTAGTIAPHEVLLWLAGRIDDDLLAWARELIAVGEDDQAVELITATLIAERAPLPALLRAWVVERSCELNLEPDAAQALPAAADDAPLHIFVGELPPNTGLSEAGARAQSERLRAALGHVAERHLRAGSWWLAWRLTPAGAAPGPLPHPVILVELGPETGTPAEVSAYQVADAVQRSGLTASVEVFDAGATLPGYHQSALRAARGEASAGPHEDAPRAAGLNISAELDIAPGLAEPAQGQHRLHEPSLPAAAGHDGPAEQLVDGSSDGSPDIWSDEWVTGEWSEPPVSSTPAGVRDTDRDVLAQVQEELAAGEATLPHERGHDGSAPQRRDVAEPPGLTG